MQLCLAAGLALGVGLHGRANNDRVVAEYVQPAVVQDAVQAVGQSAPAQVLASAGTQINAALKPVISTAPIQTTREAELDDGQTFSEMLEDAGVDGTTAAAAAAALAKVYNVRKLQAGEDFTLNFLRTDRAETLTGVTFQPEDTREFVLSRTAEGQFVAEAKAIPVERHRLAARAEISTTMYEAGNRAKIPHAIMASLMRIYAHDIDFQRDIHQGDSFEILYDQPMTTQGKAVGEGSIIYAAIHVGDKVKPIYRVIFSDNSTDYFDDKGQSIRRALLRTPVAAARITSSFGMRMHPLLGYSKMHKGVDFGASIGTPIFAAGGGIIEEIGFKNGYGRYIRIRHSGTTETAYAHMSRFNANIYRGARVNQGEVIGYVGMSGRATGPHLHFEVLVSNQQVNPMSINLPSGRNLEGALLAEFRKGETQIRQQYDSLMESSLRADRAQSNIVKASVNASEAVKANPSRQTY